VGLGVNDIHGLGSIGFVLPEITGNFIMPYFSVTTHDDITRITR